MRPDVILRFSDAKTLLLDGLLDKASSIAEHAVVVDAHLGQGNVLLFGNNPVYRGETIGTYALVFNAILNYQHLGHETATAEKHCSFKLRCGGAAQRLRPLAVLHSIIRRQAPSDTGHSIRTCFFPRNMWATWPAKLPRN